MTYRISRHANADLEAICDRIALDNPVAADNLDLRHSAIAMLSQFPGMGHSRQDVADSRYLFWTIGTYVIAYRMDGHQLLVVRVLHGRRDIARLFKRT
jgi:toxin ParE1/3/4